MIGSDPRVPHRRTRVLLAVGALSLAACGGSGDDDSTTRPDVTATPSTSPDTTSASNSQPAATTPPEPSGPVAVITDQIRLPPEGLYERLDPRVLETIGEDPASWERAAEAYDAVILLALAAEAAGTDGSASVDEVLRLTRGEVSCEGFESCRERILEGDQVDLDLWSPVEALGDDRRVAQATYHLERLAEGVIEGFEVTVGPFASDSDTSGATAERAGDGRLRIGSLLPASGVGARAAEGTRAMIDAARAEINAAGGVFGRDVDHVAVDVESWNADPTRLMAATQDLVAQGVDAVITLGPTSAMFGVVDDLTSAGITVLLTGGTNRRLDLVDDHGLMVRLAAPDDLELAALADAIAFAGSTRLAVVADADADGRAALAGLRDAAGRRDLEILTVIDWSPEAEIDPELWSNTLTEDIDGVVVLGAESDSLLALASRSDTGPATRPWFFTSRARGSGTASDLLARISDVES